MLIADTGAVYAFYDANDQYHEGVRKIVLQHAGKVIIPDLILVEIDYLLGKFLGIDAKLDFLQDVVNGVYRLHRLDTIALQNCSRLINQYRGLNLGLADTAVMTTADTLGIYDILTVDEHDFRAVKLNKPLRLLPVDSA